MSCSIYHGEKTSFVSAFNWRFCNIERAPNMCALFSTRQPSEGFYRRFFFLQSVLLAVFGRAMNEIKSTGRTENEKIAAWANRKSKERSRTENWWRVVWVNESKTRQSLLFANIYDVTCCKITSKVVRRSILKMSFTTYHSTYIEFLLKIAQNSQYQTNKSRFHGEMVFASGKQSKQTVGVVWLEEIDKITGFSSDKWLFNDRFSIENLTLLLSSSAYDMILLLAPPPLSFLCTMQFIYCLVFTQSVPYIRTLILFIATYP